MFVFFIEMNESYALRLFGCLGKGSRCHRNSLGILSGEKIARIRIGVQFEHSLSLKKINPQISFTLLLPLP